VSRIVLDSKKIAYLILSRELVWTVFDDEI
jgi:hypothetical protein